MNLLYNTFGNYNSIPSFVNCAGRMSGTNETTKFVLTEKAKLLLKKIKNNRVAENCLE